MRYRIEFMIETTEEYTVCAALACDRGLTNAIRAGYANAGPAQVEYGAGGFQIRDMRNDGRIVAIEEFMPMASA